MKLVRTLVLALMVAALPSLPGCSSTARQAPVQAASAEAFVLEVIAKSGKHQDEPALLRMAPGGFIRDDKRSNWFMGEMTAEPFLLPDGTRVQDLVVHTRSEVPVLATATLVTPTCVKHRDLRRVTGAQPGPMVLDGDGRDGSATVRAGIFVVAIRARDGCLTGISEIMQ